MLDRCVATTKKLRHFPQCPGAPDARKALSWKFSNDPTLVIVPGSALQTWKTEVFNTVRNLAISIAFQGHPSPDWACLRIDRDGNPIDPEKRFATIIITSGESLEHQVMRHCWLEKEQRLRVPFGRVIVDEAHQVRNLNTRFAKQMQRLTGGRNCQVWFVTGTPLPKGPESLQLATRCWWDPEWWKQEYQSRIREYRRALHVLDAGRSQMAHIHVEIARDRVRKKLERASEDLQRVAQWLADQIAPITLLRQTSTRFLDRRILQVPPMEQETVRLSFISPEWRARYRENYVRIQEDMAELAEQARRNNRPVPARCLTVLCISRIVASTPGIITIDGPHLGKDISAHMNQRGWHLTHKQLRVIFRSSAKLQDLVRRGAGWNIDSSEAGRSPEKLVVFADSPIEACVVYEVRRAFQEVSRACADRQTLRLVAHVAVALMHAGMTTAQKHLMVTSDFQGVTGPPRVDVIVGTYQLISRVYTMMTAARRVVLFGPGWLKSEEDQARYRIKRIGQLKPTYALRYVARETVDQLVVKRQDTKVWFDDRVLGVPGENGERLSIEQLLEVLDAPENTTS